DGVARALADKVNKAHVLGFSKDGSTNLNFFESKTSEPISAGTIKVPTTLHDKVATSKTTGTIDGSVAAKIAQTVIPEDEIDPLDPPGPSPDLLYQTLIGEIGVAAQASSRRAEIQATVTEQVDAAREAQSGVNLDAEMTNLRPYERGDAGASWGLTPTDSMLDQLINRTGLVGR